MARKKATGPVTTAGKLTVSKNALKHGATSKRLLNDDENNLYAKLIDDLSTQYVSSNPLAKFQIERIARINVQLLRIQNTIDANFELSRLESNDTEKSLDLEEGLNRGARKLGNTPNHVIEYNGQHEHSEKARNTYISIATELIASDFTEILTHEGFLNKCPKFCDYLFQESQLENLTIKNFIAEKFPKRDHTWHAMEKIVNELSKKHHPELHVPPPPGISKEQAIYNTDLHSIREAAKWLVEEKELIETYHQRAAEYQRIQEIKVQAKIPNLDQLDSLMRYQTSLQRQLSTAMGELIAITKI
jgi:hypothetical protein